MPQYLELEVKPQLKRVIFTPEGSLQAFYDDDTEPRVEISPKCRVKEPGNPNLLLINLIVEQHQELQALKALVNQHITKGHIDGK